MKLLELRTMARQLVLGGGEDHLFGLYHPHNPRKRRGFPVGTNFGHFPLAQVSGRELDIPIVSAQAGGRGQAAQPARVRDRIHPNRTRILSSFAQDREINKTGTAIRANRDRAYRRQTQRNVRSAKPMSGSSPPMRNSSIWNASRTGSAQSAPAGIVSDPRKKECR